MRTINPYFSAVRHADKIIGDSLRTKARRRKYNDGARTYIAELHRYKLVGKQQDLGEEAVMTGREAKTQNELLVEIYREEIRKEIDAGVKFGETVSVLKRWIIAERSVGSSQQEGGAK